MSAFLGPIHYWLYHKIQLQEELIHAILATATRLGWNEINEEQLDTLCGKIDKKPLEEIIDGNNIHGWLQEKIHITETRLATLVTKLLKADFARLEEIQKAAYAFGQSKALKDSTFPEEAFQALENSFLDGMPCDHVNAVIEQTEERVIWQQVQCVHQAYWQQIGGNPQVYYDIRSSVIAGMIEGTNLHFSHKENSLFEIRKD